MSMQREFDSTDAAKHAIVEPASTLSLAGATLRSAPRQRRKPAFEREFDALGSDVQHELVSVVAAANDIDVALPPVIDVLISGSPEKRAAIVEAFRTNPALGQQWQEMYSFLRNRALN